MLVQYFDKLSHQINAKNIERCQAALKTKEGVIGIATAVVLMSAVAYRRRAIKGNHGCPDVPNPSFFFGHTTEYREDPQAFIEKWAKQLGPVFRAHLFGKPTTVISGPYVREIFLNNDFNFFKALDNVFDARLLTNTCGEDKLAVDDLRVIITKHLTPKLKFYTDRVVQQIYKGIIDQTNQLKAGESNVFYHVYPFVQHIVARASASIFCGVELCENELLIDSFKNMVLEVGSELVPKPWLEPFPRLNRWRMWFIGKTSPNVKKHRKQLREAMQPVVEERLRQKATNPNWVKPNDILQDIMDEFSCPPGIDYTTYLVDWITQLIFAALHTTSENCTVALYRILDTPGLVDELFEEQQQVLKQEGYSEDVGPEVFNRELLKNFVKLDSACREAFRMRNDFIGLPHLYTGDKQITLSNGVLVQPGEEVLINVWQNHKQNFSKNSNEDYSKYVPMRFLGQDKQATKVSEEYLFFGLGRHACPGRWFALQEIMTIISLLIREYKISPVGEITFPKLDESRLPMGQFKLERKVKL
ncbi:cytochrome P450 [Radiomyces spectabilis]|uniref:cytochrome P450 n=1 Tax=Radiomyces spectabilis TaxID=64574 RepID=UPI0022208E53|nr:cytochrome P450 [Radiomyces spectabilis]KAI8394317.1 cytochrome P450 [Radiomyces spectabilis]